MADPTSTIIADPTSTIPLCGLLVNNVELISVNSSGQQGVGYEPVMSADGRFVAFTSYATNLVPGDTNGFADVFVRDRQTGQTTRISISSNGQQGNADSEVADISADGRFVAFNSRANNLVPNDTNGRGLDAFLHDRQTGETIRVSVDPNGREFPWDGIHGSRAFSVSGDGQFIAFDYSDFGLTLGPLTWKGFVHNNQSHRTNRVSLDFNGRATRGIFPSISADGRFTVFNDENEISSYPFSGESSILMYDRQLGQISQLPIIVTITSRTSFGQEAIARVKISANGQFVVFTSGASSLVPGDTNGKKDVFVYNRQTNQTTRVSVNSLGQQANGDNFQPFISADGRFVTFVSSANNLVPNDNNGADDVFVHDLQTRETKRISTNAAGQEGNDESGDWRFGYSPISADGRLIAFQSASSNLVPGDTNNARDVFVATLASSCHLECQNNQCVQIAGGGDNQCANNQDCTPPPPPQHLVCQNNQCVEVSGVGANTCSTNTDCFHLECRSNQCLPVAGTGPNQCSTQSDCVTHAACNNLFKCVQLPGPGPNTCANDAQCKSCVDTDGGNNPALPGKVALVKNNKLSTWPDFCVEMKSAKMIIRKLTEYYCDQGKLQSALYDCTGACTKDRYGNAACRVGP